MPLITIGSEEAVANRKSNEFSSWGNRSSSNRVEPIARPGFTVGFQLERGEKIFAVGSCFARNVETVLLRKGFELPMRDIFKTPSFAGADLSFINNYGVPSIYNELTWALEMPYRPEVGFLEVSEDRFVDLHLNPQLRPGTLQEAIARRSAIAEAYRTVRDCRIVILTLGLSEIWFDRVGQVYLNHTPRPSVLKSLPKRFELHVLSYEEVYSYLSKVIDLIQTHCRPDVRVLLTVSPVPLNATHRKEDVMVANTYSKSVLRTAAETVSISREIVTYYPSYEGIILSDRKAAWLDDFVHVTDDAVAVQVSRMVRAYMPEIYSQDRAREEMTPGTALIEAKRARESGNAMLFFDEFGSLSKEDHQFAIEHAAFFEGEGLHQKAVDVLSPHASVTEVAVKMASLYRKLDTPSEAIRVLLPHVQPRSKSHSFWDELTSAYLENGNIEKAKATAAAWLKATPSAVRRVSLRMGRLLKKSDPNLALSYFEHAVAYDGSDDEARIQLAETLSIVGDLKRARDMALQVKGDVPSVMKRKKLLLERLG